MTGVKTVLGLQPFTSNLPGQDIAIKPALCVDTVTGTYHIKPAFDVDTGGI